MAKPAPRPASRSARGKKSAPTPAAPVYSPGAQEIRALLRRVPDGFQAALNGLDARPEAERERIMTELARGMGKEILPLIRAAALGDRESLSLSALRVLPVFGTRAAADVLVEAYRRRPEGASARTAREGALALQARGIHVDVPAEPAGPEAPKLHLRETDVSAPDSTGSRSVAARLQDSYGVWHAIFVLWDDREGVREVFMRPFSRQDWTERIERGDARGPLLTPCPFDYARWQVTRARAIGVDPQAAGPGGIDLWDEHVGPLREGYTPPDPVDWLRDATDEQKAGLLAESRQLFRLPEVERWRLPLAECRADAERLIRIARASREEDEDSEREIEQIAREAADALVTPEVAALYAGRLEDLARVCELRGQKDRARWAAAAVEKLRAGGPPSENPFLLTLLRRSLMIAAVLMQDEARDRSFRP